MCGMRSNKREKDVMFDEKQRIVLLKTTCRFVENNVSFVGLCLNGSSGGEKVRDEVQYKRTKKGRVWHLWQQKINIAVGRCAHARVRAKEVLLDNDVEEWCQSQLSYCLLALKSYMICFCSSEKAKYRCSKWIVQFFADFSLFSPVSTHIVLEGCAIVVSLGGW